MGKALNRVKRAIKELLSIVQIARFRPRSLEDQIYKGIICKRDVCYDVGAHVGDMSRLFSMLAGPNGQVVSFEPVWPTYKTLCLNAQKRGISGSPIVTIPVGLAEVEKIALMQVPGGDFGMASLAGARQWSDAQPRCAMQTYECRFWTLDNTLKSTGLPAPDFIKIDVEGAELFVLNGAKRFFEGGQKPLMLIELFAPWELAFNYGPWEIFSLLARLGYSFLFVCPTGLVEHDVSKESPFPDEYAQGYNVLAFCKERHRDRIGRLSALRHGAGGTVLPMTPPPVANTRSVNQ